MKRVTILHRRYWRPSFRAGSSQVYEVCTLNNMSDKRLAAEIERMNTGFRTSTWSIKHDFHLEKKSDQKAYLQYCIGCYYEPYVYDSESASIGGRMVKSLNDTFPWFK